MTDDCDGTEDPSQRKSLLRLPDELILNILRHATPYAALTIGSCNKRFFAVAEDPELWKRYCARTYRYWNTQIEDVACGLDSSQAIWKNRFIDRVNRDRHNKTTFESLLAAQQYRYTKIRQIAQHGKEAKDFLREMAMCSAALPDVLARRYFATVTLGLIHRREAIGIWNKLVVDSPTSLEEQLAAFDLFVVGEGSSSVEDILAKLDEIASQIIEEAPTLMEAETIDRAQIIVRYLREHRYMGIEDDAEQHDMRHNFLAFTLNSSRALARPLQSAAIFTAIARRLGVDATPINYPGHIFIAVKHNDAEGFEGLTAHDSSHIYLDPFNHARLVPFDELVAPLREHNVPTHVQIECMAPASVRSMVLRTCRNIFQSYRSWRQTMSNQELDDVDHSHAFYAFQWCMAILQDNFLVAGAMDAIDRPHMAHLLSYFRDRYPEDVDLVDEQLGVHFRQHFGGNAFDQVINESREIDAQPREPVHRDARCVKVKYRVGQLMQHRRYGYVGVVRSWSVQCDASEDWITQMRVDELHRGRGQAFYHVLGTDGTQRYVAEDNIEPLSSSPPARLLKSAGQYFKRWDADLGMFVSNIRDEYPDD